MQLFVYLWVRFISPVSYIGFRKDLPTRYTHMDGKMARIRNCTKSENLYIISITIVYHLVNLVDFENTPGEPGTPMGVGTKVMEIWHVANQMIVLTLN